MAAEVETYQSVLNLSRRSGLHWDCGLVAQALALATFAPSDDRPLVGAPGQVAHYSFDAPRWLNSLHESKTTLVFGNNSPVAVSNTELATSLQSLK